MPKLIALVSCLLATAPLAFAGPEDIYTEDMAAWESDAKAYIAENQESEDADELIQMVQWGGSSRVWTCFARNPRSGRTFSGQSRQANNARRIALNRCNHRTSGCRISSCR